MKAPVWIEKQTLLILHGESLAEHGGLPGLRDEGLLETALLRPVHLFLYDKERRLHRLAAAYAFVLAKNHPFLDGNKRIALIAAGLFLALNRYELTADKAEAVQVILDLAAGGLSEEPLSDWIKRNSCRERTNRA